MVYTAENGKPESIGEVKNALDANDINIDGLTPVTKGYAFYWNPEENTIALVGEGKDQVQDGWYILTSNEFGEYIEATGINSLKVGHNNILGYYISQFYLLKFQIQDFYL